MCSFKIMAGSMTIILSVSAKRFSVALAASLLLFFVSTEGSGQRRMSASSSKSKTSSKKTLASKKNNAQIKKNSAALTNTDGEITISSPKPVKPTSSDRDLRTLPQVGPSEEEKNKFSARREFEEPIFRDKKPLPGVVEPPFVQPEQPLDPLTPSPNRSFEGLDFANWGAGIPPDTVGDVGPNHYVQAVNTSIGIFNKSGTRLAAFTFNNFWSGQGVGTPCANSNFGDPTVVYDPQNDRWIVADFAFPSMNPGPPFYECIAVSKTGDPVSGGWWYYAYRSDDAAHPWLPDYPKMGVWRDTLYMTANMFNFGNFVEPRVYAFRLSDLISGGAVASIVIDLNSLDHFSLLPANYRGTLPPAGRDGFMIEEGLSFVFNVYKFHPDFAVPANSTFTGPTAVSQASYQFNTDVVPSSGNNLDTLGDRTMMQAQYRNINGTESLWVQHSVQDSASRTGIQWAQIDITGGTIATTPVQQQQYINLGGDGLHRWMGSLAVDRVGNMALGYSVSNTGVNPSIRYNARLATDPPNTLPQGEIVMQAGGGSQTGNCNGGPCTRWGDYSAMTVDPVDDCTFWYTNEYYPASGLNWHTRIASFIFPGCVATTNLTVTKTADTNDGVCDADCSLREALDVADSDNVPDAISFNIPADSAGCSGTDCTITLSSQFTPFADGGFLTTIDAAAGANRITLSGGGSSASILEIDSGVNISPDNLNFTGTTGNNGNAAITINSGGTMTITNSALYGNINNSPGGALKPPSSALTPHNVTISGNQSSNGGGIINTGTVTASGLTLTNNIGGFGGGGVSNSGTFNIRNTIIAGNSSVLANNADASGTFVSQGYNLIGKADGATGFTATGDQTGTVASPLDPLLGTLGNNGGKTRTHALLTNSPAIDKGKSFGTSSDQRGLVRPYDDPAIVNASGGDGSDIGAFELQAAATPTSTPTNTATNTPTSTPTNTPTNTPMPGAGSISGTITYGNAIVAGATPTPRPVRNVTVQSTAGSPMVGPVITGTPGTYTLTGFGATSYTIKPSKPGGGNTAITSADAARVAQGVSGTVPFVSQNQRFASDTSGNGGPNPA